MRHSLKVLLGLAVAIGSASPATAALDKCQKAISKEILKLESKIVKSIVKGADTYQKAASKGDPISGITGKVNDTLVKAIDTANSKSAISKTLAKLASIGPSDKVTCSDEELYQAGFMPEAVGGDRWRRLAAVAALNTAYENASLGNGALGLQYQAMVDAGGCALCSILAKPPCVSRTCSLDPTSGGESSGSAGTTATSTTGGLPISSCNVPSIMPAGEIATVGGPQRGLDPVVISSAPGNDVVACVTTYRSMGVQNCTGTMPTVDTDYCIDHIVEDIGGILVDECEPGSGDVQLVLPDVDDEVHVGVLNGGPVVSFTTNAAAPGESFTMATNQIQILLEILGEFGGDGVPCTADDTPGTVTPPAVQAQTTGTATVTVFDRDNTEGVTLTTTGSVSGDPFDCAAPQTGSISTGAIVNAFGAFHGLLNLDQAVNTKLICD